MKEIQCSLCNKKIEEDKVMGFSHMENGCLVVDPKKSNKIFLCEDCIEEAFCSELPLSQGKKS